MDPGMLAGCRAGSATVDLLPVPGRAESLQTGLAPLVPGAPGPHAGPSPRTSARVRPGGHGHREGVRERACQAMARPGCQRVQHQPPVHRRFSRHRSMATAFEQVKAVQASGFTGLCIPLGCVVLYECLEPPPSRSRQQAEPWPFWRAVPLRASASALRAPAPRNPAPETRSAPGAASRGRDGYMRYPAGPAPAAHRPAVLRCPVLPGLPPGSVYRA